MQTNPDGSLVSGVQNVTVRVSVPKGTYGAKVDAAGNYYYELKTNIEVAQLVTFEFVDDANNETLGTPQTQEFIKGKETNITPALTTPTGYELATGQTVPKTYTLANYSKTNPVVKIHLRKDIKVSFTGNDSKTYDGQPAAVSADTLSNAITSADTDTGHNLDVSGLTAADFDWYQGNTKLDSVPSAVGTYTIKINDAGLTALKNKNKNYALTLDSKKQSYTYVINAAPATVTFQGQGSKTYDGKAATLPTDVSSGSAISANLANHESLDVSGLTAADFDWYQGSTKLDSAPTAVGDYIIKLNDAGLAALENKNKNYTLTLDPTQGYAYHITADNPDNPGYPVGPNNPINQEVHEDLIFITPTGHVVLRVPNGVSGLDNHDLSKAQVKSLIAKYMPEGWRLPTGFTVKEIQVNGLSAFVTVVPQTEDLIFVTPTGHVVLRVPNGVSGLNNHDLSKAQVKSLIAKYMPQGWRLPTGFTTKEIQVNGLSAFVTIVPVRTQTIVYFVLGSGRIVKKTMWIANAIAADPQAVTAFAQRHEPAGYHFVGIGQAHSVDLGKLAIFITVAPGQAGQAQPVSRRQRLNFVTSRDRAIKRVALQAALPPKQMDALPIFQQHMSKDYAVASSWQAEKTTGRSTMARMQKQPTKKQVLAKQKHRTNRQAK